MTDRDRFHAALYHLRLTKSRFADLTGLHRVTVSRMGAEGPNGQPFPPWVWLLLDAWQRHPDLIE